MRFLTLLLTLVTTPFESTIDRAFTSINGNEWTVAAAALDQANADQPAIFSANNFHYLRGRVAENESDWRRARDEFRNIDRTNPLYPLAVWRAARVSTKLQDEAGALEWLALLPRNFPAELKMLLAREAGGRIAVQIYQDVSTREARYERAKSTRDNPALWALIREDKTDDVALGAAQLLVAVAATASEQMEVGEVFSNHRQFEQALLLYQRASIDPAYAADSRFRLARIQFQQEKYLPAIETYLALAKDFPGTDWEKEANYQIASCYWRLGDLPNSEKAYLDYIQKYGSAGMREAATRNLIDVYRAQGDNNKALTALDRALATQLSVSTRQVFLFTKAKILFLEKRYSAALTIFRQLGRARLRSAPGAATAEELQYFEALCLSNLGNASAANAIWQKLARDEFSYYGQRAAAKLNRQPVRTQENSCAAARDSILRSIQADADALRRPLRNESDASGDAFTELVFLRLWDEAAFWMSRANSQPARRSAAAVAYMGGQYDRSISLANRLPKTAASLPLLYPAGYGKLICDAATASKVDPLWLHAIIWQESKYKADARSGAAARGLMQFIPETALSVAASIGMPAASVDKLYDPEISIRLGAAYWASLVQSLKSPELALAAYNGGPGNVQRWISKSSDPELFVADIGFVETKKYVMLVFGARAAYRSLVN